VSVGVGQHLSAQLTAGSPTKTCTSRRPRTRRKCYRNCYRPGSQVSPFWTQSACLIGRHVLFRRTSPCPVAPGSTIAPRSKLAWRST